MNEERLVPQDLDAERATLGAMLLSASAIDDAMAVITDAKAFMLPAHQSLFDLIVKTHGKGIPVDLVCISDEAKRAGVLDDVGGHKKMIELAESFADTSRCEFYARIVQSKYLSRQFISLCIAGTSDGYNEASDIEFLCGTMAQKLDSLGCGNETKVEKMHDVLERLAVAYANGEIGSHIKTGIAMYDQATGGLETGAMTVLAGRPSVGKTALALNMVVQALNEGNPVLFFSVEMSNDAMAQRLISLLAGVSMIRMKGSNLSPSDFRANVEETKSKFQNLLHIADGISNVREMAATARAYVRRHGIKVIVVDYLQLCDPPEREQNRNLAVSAMSKTFKRLARQTDAACLVLAQLNRAAANKRPELSELRDSGTIEEDADVVVMLWRKDDKRRDKINVSLAKQRNGATGEFELMFNPKRMMVLRDELPVAEESNDEDIPF